MTNNLSLMKAQLIEAVAKQGFYIDPEDLTIKEQSDGTFLIELNQSFAKQLLKKLYEKTNT